MTLSSLGQLVPPLFPIANRQSLGLLWRPHVGNFELRIKNFELTKPYSLEDASLLKPLEPLDPLELLEPFRTRDAVA